MWNKKEKMHFKLVIVTVTYKSYDDLPKFIESYYKFNDLKNQSRLIVVDNSPSEYLKIKEFINSFNDIDYISQPQNPGFGNANNIGFDLHTSDYVLFINNDVEFIMPIFDNIIQLHDKSPKLGCIGIKQLGGAPSYFKKITSNLENNSSEFDDREHFISGAFMFFKSNIFIEIGKFDSNLFMYGEEQDLSFRLNKNSYYTEYLPKLSFLHKVGDRKKLSKFSWETTTKSFCYLCRKHNIDYQAPNKRLMNRLKKLMLYFLLKLDFREFNKLKNVYNFRKKYITNYFNN